MTSTKTHQQDVVAANREIERLKQKYSTVVSGALTAISNGTISQQSFFDLQRIGAEYFNYAERFVAESSLLGAHENGIWAKNFAEDCAALLESLSLHFQLLRQIANLLHISQAEPSTNAYASMQRMVTLYLDKQQTEKLKDLFITTQLPAGGFNKPEAKMLKNGNKWQWPMVWGIGFTCAIIVLAIFFPNPTKFQYVIFRLVITIAISGLAATSLNGVIEVKFGKWLTATGTFAIFVIVFFYNPAALVVEEIPEVKKQPSVVAAAPVILSTNKNSSVPHEKKTIIKDASKQNRKSNFQEDRPKLPITVPVSSSKLMLLPGFWISSVSSTKIGTSAGSIKFFTQENGPVYIDEDMEYTAVTFKNHNYRLSVKFSPQGQALLTLANI